MVKLGRPTREAQQLFLDGQQTLAAVEANGMRIDVPYLDNAIADMDDRIGALTARLQGHEIWSVWSRTYRAEANLGSHQQLGRVLYDVVGIAKGKKSKKDSTRYVTDEGELEKIDHPFVRNWIWWQKLNKLQSTYLRGIRKKTVGDLLRPFFDLVKPKTFRSHSSDPNFQNIPVRNKKLAEIVRRAFIARDGHQLVETDFKGIEVAVAACYHKDPVMMRYLRDPSSDMHRDAAVKCFNLPAGKVPKPVRQTAKGGFVFAEFYGDWYKQVAENLWDHIAREELQTVDGVGLYDHLADTLDITALGACDPDAKPKVGTFEHHIAGVESWFWDKRFKVYKQWKRDWFDQYQRDGGFMTLTGFWCGNRMTRNEAVNYPIQGSAFHCLLWTLIKVHRWLVKNKMRTRVVGQIHDSIVADVHQDELEDYLAYVKYVVTVLLPEHWSWIIAPMEVEAEVCAPGASWFEKQEYDLDRIAI